MGIEVPRDRWDRPLIVPPAGGKPIPYARASRFAETLTDSYALDQWHQHMVAIGIVESPWLANKVVGAYRPPSEEARGYDWNEMSQVCAIAQKRAGANDKATYGSDLHKLTERLDRGEPIGSLPREAFFDLAAYQEQTEKVFEHVLHIERFGVADAIQVGGTADRISRFAGWLPHGEWIDDYFVVDIKTGKVEGKGLQFGVQLGVYSRMQLYDLDRLGNPTRTPLEVNQKWAIIVHLPKGEADCQLYWLDIRKGWEFANLSIKVREARKVKDLLVPIAC